MFELSRRCFNDYKFLRHLNETFRLITYEEHHLWIEHFSQLQEQKQAETEFMSLNLKEKLICREKQL